MTRPLSSHPRRARRLFLAAGAATIVLALSPALGAKAASTVSLSGWKLTLPVDSSGCQCGSAATIDPATVKAPWLTRDSDGGRLTFTALTQD
jgi:hypothetical protein